VSLATPEQIRKLQRALYVKAKQEPTRRFHFLYDKVWREDLLVHAYACCRANGGAPGVDGETFSRIESYGVERWLDELREEVRVQTAALLVLDPIFEADFDEAAYRYRPKRRALDAVRTVHKAIGRVSDIDSHSVGWKSIPKKSNRSCGYPRGRSSSLQ
jgi:RNA-directed DNA polymerase